MLWSVVGLGIYLLLEGTGTGGILLKGGRLGKCLSDWLLVLMMWVELSFGGGLLDLGGTVAGLGGTGSGVSRVAVIGVVI